VTGEGTSICPGCGVALPSAGPSPDESAAESRGRRFNSSIECWTRFGELSAYTLGHGDPGFIHQHAVDAWQAQHMVASPSNIGIAFSLIGLYLALEKSYTGREVQRAHMKLARTKRQWGEFEKPSARAPINVLDVLLAEAGPARDAMLMKWAAAVWASWSHAHEWTKETCTRLLNVS